MMYYRLLELLSVTPSMYVSTVVLVCGCKNNIILQLVKQWGRFLPEQNLAQSPRAIGS